MGPDNTGANVVTVATLTIDPQLSSEAARAFAMLKGTELDIDNVHVRLTGAGTDVRDTVITLPAGQELRPVDVHVRLLGAEQTFAALVELRAVDGTVLFSATQDVKVRAPNQAPLPARVITIDYTGPGRAVTSVTISPSDVNTTGIDVRALVASATDAASKPVTDVPVRWTSSDTTIATVASTGRATASVTTTGKRGTATITATTPLGVASAIAITVGARPTQIVVVSGNGQSAVVGSDLPQPLIVEVRAADGLPVSGVSVGFRAMTTGSGVSRTSAVTDAVGRASTTMTLSNSLGSHAFEVSATAVPTVTVTATALARVPATITVVVGDGQSAIAGSAVRVAPAVVVKDAKGDVMPGTTVVFAIASGGGMATGATTTTNAAGIGTVGSWTLGSAAGLNTLTASAGPVSATFSATGTAGVLSTIRVVSAPLTLVAGAVANFTFGIVDAFGNAVAQLGVVFSLVYSTATGQVWGGGPVTTDAHGVGTFSISPVNMPLGTATFVLTAPGLATLTFTTPVVAGTATALRLQDGWPLSATSGVRLAPQPAAQVVDAASNPVRAPGLVVTAALVAGAGTLSGTTTAVTDANGSAVFTDLTVTGLAGTHSIELSTPTLTSYTTFPFTLGSGAAASISAIAGNNQSATAGSAVAVAPAVRVTDAAGNPVNHVVVTFAVGPSGGQLSAGGTTSSTVSVDALNGIAQLTRWTLGATAGTQTVTATPDVPLAGAPVVFTATALPLASRLKFVTAPPSSVMSGVRIAQQPSVALVDANGVAVSAPGVVITASVTSGVGMTHNASAVTNAAGVATFTDLIITGNAGPFALSFTSPGYSPLDVPSIDVVAFTGSIAIAAGNNQSAVVGTSVAVAPAVLVKDASGAPLPGALVEFVVNPSGPGSSISAGGVSNTNSLRVMSDGQGIARLTSWTLATDAAWPNGLNVQVMQVANQYVAFSASGHAGPAAMLRIRNMPTSGTNGVPFNPAPALQLADRYFNTVTQSNVVVTASFISVQNGSFTNATAITDSNGTATFSALTVSALLVGDVILGFDAPGLTSAQSPIIAMRAGAPYQLRAIAGNGQAATAGTQVLVPPSVIITDYAGNGLPGLAVTFDNQTPGALLETAAGIQQPATVVTDAAGIASLRSWTLSPTAGVNTIVARTTSLPNQAQTFTGTALAPNGNVLSIVTAPTSTTSGAIMVVQPVVQLRNASNAPINQAGVPVTAAIIGAGGVLSGTVTVTTNASGVATFTDLVLTGPAGPYSLRFSSPGYGTVSASLTM